MEKLHELHDDGGFDLIVVDTPPTRHALDFLDAPRRLLRLLDNRIFRLLMVPARSVLARRRRRGAGVPAHGVAGRRRARCRRHHRLLPSVRGHGSRLPRRAPSEVPTLLDDAGDRVRARHVAAARRGRRGRVLRRAHRASTTCGRRARRQPCAPALRRTRSPERAASARRSSVRGGRSRTIPRRATRRGAAARTSPTSTRSPSARSASSAGSRAHRQRGRRLRAVARPRRARLRRARRGRRATRSPSAGRSHGGRARRGSPRAEVGCAA